MNTILFDFSKAFDRVSHKRLQYKLNHYGIRSITNKWITDYLGDRTQKVIVDGANSDASPVESEIPQGSVLGPVFKK